MYIKSRTILIILCSILPVNGQYSNNTPQICKQRNQQTIKTLKSDNPLFHSLERNEIGNGIHQSWMSRMQSLNVKQVAAVVYFEIKGQDIKLSLKKIDFYNLYYFAAESQIKNIGDDKQALSDDLRIPFFNEALRLIEAYKINKKGSCGNLYLHLLDDACLPKTYTTDTLQSGQLGQGSVCAIEGEEPNYNSYNQAANRCYQPDTYF